MKIKSFFHCIFIIFIFSKFIFFFKYFFSFLSSPVTVDDPIKHFLLLNDISLTSSLLGVCEVEASIVDGNDPLSLSVSAVASCPTWFSKFLMATSWVWIEALVSVLHVLRRVSKELSIAGAACLWACWVGNPTGVV